LTNNQTEIALLYINFDYKYYQEHGKVGSCHLVAHPLLRDDQYIKDQMNEIVDYIREKYNMKEM
jgi:hypothetical protein